MQKLYETYQACVESAASNGAPLLAPPFHIIQQAHIEVRIDGAGIFREGRIVPKEDTVIPASEKSATARTSAVVPHPLCDHVKYCAGDYKDENGDNPYFQEYLSELEKWCSSTFSHPKAIAVLNYVKRLTLFKDLVRNKIIPLDADGKLVVRWDKKDENKPELLRYLSVDPVKKTYKPQNALIRWIVESTGDPCSRVWQDSSLQDSWMQYAESRDSQQGLCMVTASIAVLADKHPKGIRGGKDGAKLISYKKEEDSDFIYLGRFLSPDQALGISREVSQKAHAVLKWLIARQGHSSGGKDPQIFVAWAVSGHTIPDPWRNTSDLLGDVPTLAATNESPPLLDLGDVGQAFALRLNRAISGYRANIHDTEAIIVMGLDSAVPGRLAITFYRELTGSDFLSRVQTWHEENAWPRRLGKDLLPCAPAPKEIAFAAYGKKIEGKNGEKLLKATLERLIPCIIDGQPIPRDLVDSCVHRACHRLGFDRDIKKNDEHAWEKCLSIACALIRGSNKERGYQMILEENRKTRNYLFGQLLAVAERIEETALWIAKENRDTTAAKLMQHFADQPFSTWLTIEKALVPYHSRVRAKWPGYNADLKDLLDSIVANFDPKDFTNDSRLDGEFLLGYHCQRQKLRTTRKRPDLTESAEPLTDSIPTEN